MPHTEHIGSRSHHFFRQLAAAEPVSAEFQAVHGMLREMLGHVLKEGQIDAWLQETAAHRFDF